MKTTIELPDETLRKAKVLAAEQQTTLKEVISAALDRFLESSRAESEEVRKADLARLLSEMRAANTEPMKPLSREEAHGR